MSGGFDCDVMLVGAYPPPIGGVSVHVRRLARLIADWHRYCRVIDPYGGPLPGDPPSLQRCGPGRLHALWRTRRALRTTRSAVVHFHVASMRRFVWAGPLLLDAVAARTVLTIHSGSFPADVQAASVRQRRRLGALLCRFDYLVTVNEQQRATLVELGVDRARTCCCPAYLPAPEAGDVAVDVPASDYVLSSGYGIPLYGYEDVIDALAAEDGPDRALVLCLYNDIDEHYVAALERRAAGRVTLMIHRDLDEDAYATVLRSASLYVRATDRDGDSIAVREALAAGVPVIATDVVPRPDDVVLYERGNPVSLQAAFGAQAGGTPDVEGHQTLEDVRSVFESAYDLSFG